MKKEKFRQLWMFLFVLVSSLSFCFNAFAHLPIPFDHPGSSGYVLVLWSDYTDSAINQMLDRIKKTGARTISLPIFGCQTSITSSDVGGCDVKRGFVRHRTTAAHIAQLVTAQGLQPIFLPIVVTSKWEWRGFFNPTDVDGWFKTYTTWLMGVAAQANKLGMKELIVGSEFSNLYRYGDRWKQLLHAMHASFAGPLIVTVNWGMLDFSFWDEADAIGVSDYYPLVSVANPGEHSLGTPTQAELDQGEVRVKRALLDASNKYHRPIYITELGFPSTSGAAKTPWQVLPTDKVDWALQAGCFQAFTKAWNGESKLVRTNIWATGDLSDPRYNSGFETLGKPAEKVLTDFFMRRSF